MRRMLLPLLLLAVPLLADEGMWMPQQMPQLASELRKRGIELDPARLADLTGDPMGAVVSLGGCTASFVSPDGLILTNHHCAFGSIQHNSTPERDLITDGFLARTREQELPAAPGTKVWVTTKIEDVTARVIDGTAKLGDAERARAIERREKELIAECEKPGGVRCTVSSFFEGSQYLRTTQMELTEIKLVYAPSSNIGDFGGEIDNFEWPRHTGDFAFYRAYRAGKPYRPQHWLKLSTDGIDEGDAVIVAGYPGRTFRYKTADEVRNYKEFLYPVNIRYSADVIRLLEEAGKDKRDVQIRNASRIAGLANALKNYTSVSEGFVKDRILEQRIARDEQMRGAAEPLMNEIARVNAEKLRSRERDLILDWITGRGSPMAAQALAIVRVATERPKKDIDRLAKYQEREWKTLQQASDRAQRVIDAGSDRAVMRYFLAEAAKLPAEQRIKALEDVTLDRLYGATKIGVQEERTKMFGESAAQLRARGDAMLDFAFSLLPLLDAREERDLAWTGAMARLRPGYFDALRKLSGGALYPDANSTLRLTFGRVEGYRPKDATWFTPQTSLRGILEKETGKDPFASPKSLLAAAADPAKTKPYLDAELKDVPVNFLSTCDTTGGNSGSPTLNAKGELTGLLFDGNYESLDSDFQFNPADTRSIHVDVEYMLWVMDAVDGASELMRELGVEPR
ncbi:MAG TPA: S46 family peptidase [Thermoanaerobaculia bacterium]|nr:S46 family peptidase [Thermoanaerobaculia bacterium]